VKKIHEYKLGSIFHVNLSTDFFVALLGCKLLPAVGQNASRSNLWNPTSPVSLPWASFIQSTYS